MVGKRRQYFLTDWAFHGAFEGVCMQWEGGAYLCNPDDYR